MRKMKSFITLFGVVILLLSIGHPTLGKERKQFMNKEGYYEITGAKITLEWKIDGPNLEVILTAPTRGWVAVGFDPSSLMKDANLIIGYVKDDETFVRDDFGNYFTSHVSDESLGGSNDVVIKEGEEKKKETKIAFIIPLNSGDKYDKVLEAGKSYTVMLAYGDVDKFDVRHRKRAKVKITL